jgi:hypothetical protein
MKKENKETVIAVSIILFCLFADKIWDYFESLILR